MGPFDHSSRTALGLRRDREEAIVFLWLKLALDSLLPGDLHLIGLQGVELELGLRQEGIRVRRVGWTGPLRERCGSFLIGFLSIGGLGEAG